MTEFWQGMSRGARTSLIAGVLAIVLLMCAVAWWLLKIDYQVLFSDLKPQDVAAMTAELDKLKIPYRVDDTGAAILVDKAQVHTTRIKLMDKDVPLHGAIGLELFNNTDFGMTEFAQKINYQRALQGELTRTILSLSEIRDVRVHLALPEQGLFKQANARPKAALTLTLREGQSLRPEQVSGIQRLVAAATPGMTPADVTVVDRQGVALSRLADDATDGSVPSGGSAGAGSNARLALKKETEDQLARKAGTVLDKAFGPGRALVSVDVTLNMDQVRTTTEDVIPAASRGADSKGVIVKERESVHDGNIAPLDAARVGGAAAGGSTQRDVDYQVGRRVEQVVSSAGAVRRMQVVAVVQQALDGPQEEQLRKVLSAAVGASPERGDTVVVQSLAALLPAPGAVNPQQQGVAAASAEPPSEPADVDRVPVAGSALPPYTLPLAVAVAVAVAVMVMLLLSLTRGRRTAGRADVSRSPLAEAERQAALRQVQAWMQQTGPVPGTPAGMPSAGGYRT